jgi:hypothetical protein
MSKRTFEAYSTLQESHVPEYCPGWTCLGAILNRSLGFWWLYFRWPGSPKDSLSFAFLWNPAPRCPRQRRATSLTSSSVIPSHPDSRKGLTPFYSLKGSMPCRSSLSAGVCHCVIFDSDLFPIGALGRIHRARGNL